MTDKILILYGRRDCHLCDEMRVALERWRTRLGFVLELKDIDEDPELLAGFGDKVPVLMHGDHEICHYFLDESALLRCLGREAESRHY